MMNNEIVDVVPGPNCDLTEESLEQALISVRTWANSNGVIENFKGDLTRLSVPEAMLTDCQNDPPSIKYWEMNKMPYMPSCYICYCGGCRMMINYYGYFRRKGADRRIVTKNGRIAKRK